MNYQYFVLSCGMLRINTDAPRMRGEVHIITDIVDALQRAGHLNLGASEDSH